MTISVVTAVVTVPAGVRHYQTSGFAESWEAYNALTVEDGWVEQSYDDAVDPTVWKTKLLGQGSRVTIFRPHDEEPQQ